MGERKQTKREKSGTVVVTVRRWRRHGDDPATRRRSGDGEMAHGQKGKLTVGEGDFTGRAHGGGEE